MSKPNWDDAPEYANWLSQDSDGQWCWWNLKPNAWHGNWEHGKPSREYCFSDAGYGEKPEDYTSALEQRP